MNTNTGTKQGFGRANTMKNGNNQNQEEGEQQQSYPDEIKNNTNDENKQINPKNNSDNYNESYAKDDSPSKKKEGQTTGDQVNTDNPPLKYTFTINGKSMKQIEDSKMNDEEEEDKYSDVLLSTEIREGNTPQLSEEDEYLQYERIYDKKDISLADLGDGMINEGLVERKMTLHKAATLKKSGTLKKKLEKKQIIHALDIQPSRDYFMPEFFKQLTRKNTHKQQNDYTKTNTLFVPQPQQ